MTPRVKNLLFASTALALIAGVNFYNKIIDLKDNVKFFIDGFRVHGIVNNSYLRVFTKVRLINQAQSVLNVTDLQVFIQYIDNKTPIDLGASIQSSNLTVVNNSTQVFEVGTDINLFAIPYSLLPGLLTGKAITLRVTTSFTAFGKRLSIPTDQKIQIPASALSIVQLLFAKK